MTIFTVQVTQFDPVMVGVYSYFLIHIIAKDDTSLLDIYNTYATEKIAKQKQ